MAGKASEFEGKGVERSGVFNESHVLSAGDKLRLMYRTGQNEEQPDPTRKPFPEAMRGLPEGSDNPRQISEREALGEVE